LKVALNDIFPDEDQGFWVHLLGPTCWCQPFMRGTVVVHRPQEAWQVEIEDMLLKSAKEGLVRK